MTIVWWESSSSQGMWEGNPMHDTKGTKMMERRGHANVGSRPTMKVVEEPVGGWGIDGLTKMVREHQIAQARRDDMCSPYD